MLSRIEIRNFVLIEAAELDFQDGLNIISGETGSGKSILLDALLCLFGARMNREVLRQGAERCELTAVLDFDLSELNADLLERLSLTAEEIAEKRLIVYRSLEASGKSQCRINGRLLPVALVKQLAGELLEIHGQNDQQRIFSTETQTELLNRFAGPDFLELLALWRERIQERRVLTEQLEKLGADPFQREQRLDLLRYQIAEIEAAQVQDDELATLQKQVRRLAAFERLDGEVQSCARCLQGGDDDYLDQSLRRAAQALDFSAKHNQELAAIQDAFLRLADELGEEIRHLDQLSQRLPDYREELSRLQERQSLVLKLLAKYGGSEARLAQFYENAVAEERLLANCEQRFTELCAERETLDHSLDELAAVMAQHRQRAAKELAEAITAELQALDMPQARFVVHLEEQEKLRFSPNGREAVRFDLAINPGEGLYPLAKVASGGETSRILLAIKTVLAEVDACPLLIFDEIDSGLSGRATLKVAAALKRLARRHQILCISHSAQICARAQVHFVIEKTVEGERTYSTVRCLDRDERKREIARLLSGHEADPSSLELAEVLLKEGENHD